MKNNGNIGNFSKKRKILLRHSSFSESHQKKQKKLSISVFPFFSVVSVVI